MTSNALSDLVADGLTCAVYPVIPETLEQLQGPEALKVWLAQLQCQATFGLHAHDQIASSILADHTQSLERSMSDSSGWAQMVNSMANGLTCQAYSQAPMVLISFTYTADQNILASNETIQALGSLLSRLPEQVVVVIIPVPLDPVPFVASVYAKYRPVAPTEDAKKSSLKQARPWLLSEIRLAWLQLVQRALHVSDKELNWMQEQQNGAQGSDHNKPKVSKVSHAMQVLARVFEQTMYLCLPSLVLASQWTFDAELLAMPSLEQRRHQMVWQLVLRTMLTCTTVLRGWPWTQAM